MSNEFKKRYKIPIKLFNYNGTILAAVMLGDRIYWSLEDIKKFLGITENSYPKSIGHIREFNFGTDKLMLTSEFADTQLMLTLMIKFCSNFLKSDFRLFLNWIVDELEKNKYERKHKTNKFLNALKGLIFVYVRGHELEENIIATPSDMSIIRALKNISQKETDSEEIIHKYVDVRPRVKMNDDFSKMNDDEVRVFYCYGKQIRTKKINGRLFVAVTDACAFTDFQNRKAFALIKKDDVCFVKIPDRIGRVHETKLIELNALSKIWEKNQNLNIRRFMTWALSSLKQVL